MLNLLSTWLTAAQLLVVVAAFTRTGTFVHDAGRWKMTFDIDKDNNVVLTFEVPGKEPFVGMPFPLSGGPGTYTLVDEVVLEAGLFEGVTLWHIGIRSLLPEADISPADLSVLTFEAFDFLSTILEGRKIEFKRVEHDPTPGVFEYAEPTNSRYNITLIVYADGQLNIDVQCGNIHGARATFTVNEDKYAQLFGGHQVRPFDKRERFDEALGDICDIVPRVGIWKVSFVGFDAIYAHFGLDVLTLSNEGKPLPPRDALCPGNKICIY
ncbi:hypothetical protein FOZ60_012089 [Perkinsus olseni]|uniref:Uncharacterized protein n=2 Tax=Perkinsus olseni TaxID=32597 RepID=A0A7J6NDA1_PEROL|nr:hypothetical protein FOZ60_012089 [Perkinsus olseni]